MMDLVALKLALAPTRAGLEAAGFDLVLHETEGRLCLSVQARADPHVDVCEDCLVPKALFRQMAQGEITEAGLPAVPIDVLYPLDTRRARS